MKQYSRLESSALTGGKSNFLFFFFVGTSTIKSREFSCMAHILRGKVKHKV